MSGAEPENRHETEVDAGGPPGLRDRLLAAARQVLAREGLEGLTLRAIAREAGVSHGAPRRHFPTLGALLAALGSQGFHDLATEVDRAVAGGEGPRQRIMRAGAGYVRFALAQPGIFGLMFRPELIDTADPGYQEAATASFGQLRALVAAAQADGWQPDRPTDQLTTVLWANVHGLAQLWLHGAAQAIVGPDSLDDLVGISTSLAFDV